jgi:hypothetical protein
MFTSGVSPSAQVWDSVNPYRLQQSMLVKARSLQYGTNWSALTEAQFDVGTIGVPIRITEINYNPPGGSGFEFIELRNVGSAPVDLSGMYFDGIEFTFLAGTILQPGATLVLSSDADPNGFAARYPGVAVAGRFGGSLNNAGERITLYDRTGAIVFTVDYDDENGWPTAADGQGSSLEISDVYGDPDDPANWRASTTQYGTPNQLTPAPGLAAVRINEIMADNVSAVANAGTYPDWVELHNAGGAAVDLEGWSITDDGNSRKWVFAAGTSIPAGGYLVVWCDAITNTTPGIPHGIFAGPDGRDDFSLQRLHLACGRSDVRVAGLGLHPWANRHGFGVEHADARDGKRRRDHGAGVEPRHQRVGLESVCGRAGLDRVAQPDEQARRAGEHLRRRGRLDAPDRVAVIRARVRICANLPG